MKKISIVFVLIFSIFTSNLNAQNNSDKYNPSEARQLLICDEMLLRGLNGAQTKLKQYGYDLNDIYDCTVCDSMTKADLIKHRASMPTARADLMSFARLFIRQYKDPEKLTFIFNSIIDNPGEPSGTLLDWVDFYSKNPRLSEEEKINFAAYEVTIRRFGGKRISEMTDKEKKKYRQKKCVKP